MCKLKNVILMFLICGCLFAQNDFSYSGKYLGQIPPGLKAKIFLDNVISKKDEPEMCAAFTADAKEFYFNKLLDGNWAIYFTKEIDGKWTEPKPMEFSGDFTDRDFTISPDGNKIYFGSDRPLKKGGPLKDDLDIFVSERTTDGWSEPKRVLGRINTYFGENYPSVATNGNMYFFSGREDSHGGCDIYFSEFKNGKYRKAKVLSSEINSEKHDWDSVIAPDESFIIYSSMDREDTIGGQDLYISFKNKNGFWTKAKNMGRAINSPYAEICPSISNDGKYLFFTSRRRGKADIFWIDIKIIDNFR